VNVEPAILSARLRAAASELRSAGVADAMADARILAAAALGLSREDMLREPHREMDAAGLAAFDGMIDRRCRREPVARILGSREFRSLDFRLGADTLDPRADSETLVDAALAWGKRFSGPLRVLDVGTGTGCLLLAVLHELPGATGTGTDIAAGAVEIAVRNAGLLNLAGRATFVRADWTDGVAGRFDLVLSNPPYIETAAIAGLAPEVAVHDPVRALDGGPDGLDAYRALARRLGNCLSPEGVAIMEIGPTQCDAVTGIFEAHGFPRLEIRQDFGGRPRCLVFAAQAVSKWLTPVVKKGLETP
tara:strand:+ start:22443 stop:23354 length:912 start_codon:yes stop_codon:yes gene_type:complete